MSPKGPFWRSGDAEYKESKSSTPQKVTPELFLSRDGELRDIQKEFSESVRYMLRSLVQIVVFQSLSMSLLLNLLFDPDHYSFFFSFFLFKKHLGAKSRFDTAENDPLKVGMTALSEHGA